MANESALNMCERRPKGNARLKNTCTVRVAGDARREGEGKDDVRVDVNRQLTGPARGATSILDGRARSEKTKEKHMI